MVEFNLTLLEYHGPDTATGLLGGVGKDGPATDSPHDQSQNDQPAKDAASGRSLLVVLVVLGILIGIGAALRWLTGEEDEDVTPTGTDTVEITEYED